MGAQFLVLGLLGIADDNNERVVLPPSRSATLLAALLLAPNEVVPVGYLKRVIWGDRLPTTARATLQTYVSRLRALFGKFGLSRELIETVPGGYRLGVPSDLVSFTELTRSADAASDPETELELLSRAQNLWHGELLANVDSEVLHRDAVPKLHAQWLAVVQRRFALELHLGRHRGAITDLRALTEAHPAHEPFWALLAQALAGSGRRTDALTACRAGRGHTDGAELRRLEAGILADTPQRTDVFPADLPQFVGRSAEIDALRAHLDANLSGPAIVVLTGPPGIGKSALAVRIGHLLAERFPSRCFVPLPQGRVPEAGDGPRLLVLDDAADAEQVAPLLTGRRGDLIIVTSRNCLPALSVNHGARVIRLAGLLETESHELLGTLLDAQRVQAEPDAVSELVAVCSGFPIALRIAAARLALRPKFPIAGYVTALRAAPATMLALQDVSVAELFGEFLDADAARICASPAAELTPEHWATTTLEHLVARNVLEQCAPARYHVPEIFRLLAAG